MALPADIGCIRRSLPVHRSRSLQPEDAHPSRRCSTPEGEHLRHLREHLREVAIPSAVPCRPACRPSVDGCRAIQQPGGPLPMTARLALTRPSLSASEEGHAPAARPGSHAPHHEHRVPHHRPVWPAGQRRCARWHPPTRCALPRWQRHPPLGRQAPVAAPPGWTWIRPGCASSHPLDRVPPAGRRSRRPPIDRRDRRRAPLSIHDRTTGTDVYAHLTRGMQQRAADRMDVILEQAAEA